MNLRRAALLVAIVAGCNILFSLATLFAIIVPSLVRLHLPLQGAFSIGMIGFYCEVFSVAVFFAFFFAESSGRTGSHARAMAALAATGLILVTAVSDVWAIDTTIHVCTSTNADCVFSVPVAVATDAFMVLTFVGWAVFFFAFAEKVNEFHSDIIPKLAVLLGVVDVVVSVIVLFSPPLNLNREVGNAIFVCQAIAFLVFAVLLYRKWDSRKPIHDMILGEALQLNLEQNP